MFTQSNDQTGHVRKRGMKYRAEKGEHMLYNVFSKKKTATVPTSVGGPPFSYLKVRTSILQHWRGVITDQKSR